MRKDITTPLVKLEGYSAQQLLSGDPAKSRFPLHLASANGFPVACYRDFVSHFDTEFSVTAVDHRGAWREHPAPLKQFGTNDFAADLIEAVETMNTRPVIGIGHSHGGVVVSRAAQLRPDLFKAVIIIDGATTPHPVVYPILSGLPVPAVLKLFSFVRGSHERQRYWRSREEFLQRYARHRTFKGFTENAMNDYAQYGLRPIQSDPKPTTDAAFELSFSPHWESHIFRSVGYIWSLLKRTSTPTLWLRAEHSNLYTAEQFAQRAKALGPAITLKTIKGTGHLAPFEDPAAVVSAIQPWLEATS